MSLVERTREVRRGFRIHWGALDKVVAVKSISGCNIRRFSLVVREMQRFEKPVESEGDGAENVPRILSMSSVQESDDLERGKIMDGVPMRMSVWYQSS
jgi:hypothetical protein